jgi:hypothetical protein
MGRGLLLWAFALGAVGCAFEVDYGGTRFLCEEAADCPGGTPCTGGYCQYTDPGGGGDDDDAVIAGDGDDRSDDDPDGEGDDDGDLGGDAGDVPIEWLGHASGALDTSSLLTVTTDTALAGDDGDLYIAALSLKPRREVERVVGLGLDWHMLDQQCSGRSTAKVALFWAQGTPAAPGVVAAELDSDGATGSAVLSVHRYRGASLDLPIGGYSFGNSTGHDGGVLCTGGDDTAVYAWETLDTTAPGSIVLVAAHTANYPSHAPGDGFVERADRQSGTSSTSAGVAVQEASFADPTTDVLVSGSFDSKPDWAVIAIEVRN